MKSKIRRLDFTSLFPLHLMIIYIIFVHTSLYVMVLQVGKLCVLNLPEKYNHCIVSHTANHKDLRNFGDHSLEWIINK